METGCIIDGGHMSSLDFIVAVIRYAAERGFELDEAQMDRDIADLEHMSHNESDYYEIMDALDWTYEDALEYLNSTAAERFYTVEDQSLFLEESDD